MVVRALLDQAAGSLMGRYVPFWARREGPNADLDTAATSDLNRPDLEVVAPADAGADASGNAVPGKLIASPFATAVRVAPILTGQYTTDSNSAGQTPLDTSKVPYSRILVTLTGSAGSKAYLGGLNVTSLTGIPLVSGTGPVGTVEVKSNDPRAAVRLCDLYVTGAGTANLVIAWLAVG